MKNLSIKELFDEQGYVSIPGIINPQQVDRLRNDYQRVLNRSNMLTISPVAFLQEDGLIDVLFSDAVVRSIGEVLEVPGYQLYPDFTIRQSLYIPWHTDASHLTEEQYELDKQADFVQCSIYLQDNNWETGGGLEVIPGSHRNPKVNRRDPVSSIGFDVSRNSKLLESKAGDLVLWDSRIVHRSVLNKDADIKKLAMQWTISRTSRFSSDYLTYLQMRAEKQLQHVSDKGTDREQTFLLGSKEVSPKSFCKDLKMIMNNNSINMQYIKGGCDAVYPDKAK